MSESTNLPEWELTLTLLDSDRKGPMREWRFRGRETIQIGRSEDNDVRVLDKRVSRCHAVLSREGENWSCASCGSNGTYVAGHRISHVTILDGTILQLDRNGPRLLCMLKETESDPSSLFDKTPISVWIEDLRTGDEDAAQKLWEYYFDSISRLAKRKLGFVPRRAFDEEDVAINVFNSLFIGVSEGRFPELTHRDGLWRLLVVMTARKVINQIHHERRQKRGGGGVRGESIMISSEDSANIAFAQVMGDEPTPEFAAMLVEETNQRLQRLGDESLREIARWKMEGYSNDEIAEKMECTTRTVERKLQQIREIWSE